MHSGMRFGILAAAALGSYPLYVLFAVWQRRDGILPELLTLLTAGLFLLSLLHGFFAYPLETRSLLAARATALTAAALTGVVTWFLAGDFSLFGRLLLTLAFTAAYLTGWRLRRFPPEDMLRMGVFLGLTTAFFLVLLCLVGMHLPFDLWRLWVVYGILVVLFGILRSRMAFFRAGYRGRTLRHHGMLIALFALPAAIVLAIGIGLSQPIGRGLAFLWQQFVRWFRRLFVVEAPEDDGFEEPMEAVPGGMDDLLQEQNPWISWILTLLCIGLAIWLLVRYRTQIADFLMSLFRRVTLHLQHFLTAKATEEPIEQTAEYADYVQTIEEGTALPHRDRRAGNWRRTYRKYRHMPAGTERFRLGYALWLAALELGGTAISPTDTPAEVCEKASSPEAETVTACYYAVRYGGAVPTPEAEQALERLLKRR